LLACAEKALWGKEGIILKHSNILEEVSLLASYDLVVMFGLLHGIAGRSQRINLMGNVASKVRKNNTEKGLLAFSCWRFIEFKRFQKKIIPWSTVLSAKVEPNDFLLDWREGIIATRYCHYVDDKEHNDLVKATNLTELETYNADGFNNQLNCYSVLTA